MFLTLTKGGGSVVRILKIVQRHIPFSSIKLSIMHHKFSLSRCLPHPLSL